MAFQMLPGTKFSERFHSMGMRGFCEVPGTRGDARTPLLTVPYCLLPFFSSLIIVVLFTGIVFLGTRIVFLSTS